MSWSSRADRPYRLAVGSFIEEYCNKIRVIQINPYTNTFEELFTFSHSYPATRIQFLPSASTAHADIIATTGDYLRIWDVKENRQVKMKAMLTATKHSDYCAPLTAFDWNEIDTNVVATSSVDTTCTVWDLQSEAVTTQLIAHDSEVYDIAFSARQPKVFATAGADGSVRIFDLRNLEHSTVIFENSRLSPLLRVQWNKIDGNYLAALPIESNKVIVVDIRYPSIPAAELAGHHAIVDGFEWAPHSSCHMCTVGDDRQALIWDLQALPEPIEEPILAYSANGEINQARWSALQPDWVAISFGDKVQALRV